ncbi:MAG: amino acid ABC transporter substrate-binding protein [Victivallales bacterium]|nr:amino acid ABC transporter substrate-binding protein [Victivallales bacterium]
MKKFLLSLLGLCCVLALVAGCSQKEDSGNVLKVGFDASFPPYGLRTPEGELVGFDLDLAAEVAKRRGWELILKPIDWDAKDAELDSGTINCIWNGFTINGREDKYTWSVPYVNNSIVVAVRANSGMTKLNDMAGKNVVTQADSSALAALKDAKFDGLRNSFKKLTEVPTYTQAFMELQAGACDAVVVDEGVAVDFLKKNSKEYVLLTEEVKEEQYGIGFKLGNTALRDQVQETLLEMVADGTFAKISAKWFEGRDVWAGK